MLPTSRNSSTPPALSVIVNSSGASAPLNTSVSVPLRPLTKSLPSPGFQMKSSSPAPRMARSLPVPPLTIRSTSDACSAEASITSSSPSAFSSIASTWLSFIRMLPTSRNSSTPSSSLPEMVKFSTASAPLNSSVSAPRPPRTVSLPSPGFQMKRSLPFSRRATWSPGPGCSTSSPGVPMVIAMMLTPQVDGGWPRHRRDRPAVAVVLGLAPDEAVASASTKGRGRHGAGHGLTDQRTKSSALDRR